MKVEILEFKEFTAHKLYEILRLRSEVFVVEQDCVYQDLDNKDQKAIHILGSIKGVVVAYTRFFKPGDYFENASIGRVVVHPKYRGKDYGKEIMQESIDYARTKGHSSLIISAQCYLDKFYTDLGFTATGKEYLEDGIPHQEMVMRLN